MMKVLAVRLIKDIFVTGNLSFFSELHPSIEENLYKIATYNYKAGGSRGENYFIETLNAEKNDRNKKMGNSYVLFAT